MSGNSSELFIEGLPGSLSQEESDKLFEMARQGDKEARNELILHNVKLVMYEVKKRFGFTGFDVEDLVSVGNIGLIKAVETFDREKGFNFSSYATRCIDNEILMYLNKSRSEKVDTSLDKPVVGGHDDDEMDIMDTIKDDTDIVNEWLAKERFQIIREAVEKLPEQGREIIKLYFGFYNNKTYTQNEISKILSISQFEVSKKIKSFLSDLNVTLYNEGVVEKNYFENRSSNNRKRKVKSIYEHFSSYAKEEVDDALAGLTDEEKRLIALRYDDNLENPISNKMNSEKINGFYYKLLDKIGKKLALTKLFKTQNFIDETSGYSTDEKTVKALSEGYIDGRCHSLSTIAKFLGIEETEAATLLEKVQILGANGNGKEKPIKTNSPSKSIYEYFSSYTKEQIDSVLEELTDEEKRLITLRYGNDLENPVSSKMTSKETNAFYYTLFRKMKKKLALLELLKTQDFINETSEYSTAEKMVKALKDGYIDGTRCSLPTIANILGIEREEAAKLLKNIKVSDANRNNRKEKSIKANRTAKSIYEYFSSYTKEQVDSVLNELTDEEKELITLRYGEDLENPIPNNMTSKEANAFYYTLFRKIKKKLAVSELLKTQDFINETSEYSTAEKIVKALREGYIDGTHWSLPTIAKFLGIEEAEAATLLENVKALDATRKEKSINADRTAKSIYKYFSTYTKEQIDSVLEELTDEEKRLITLRYGNDLENPISSGMNSKEANTFYFTLFRKMKKKLALLELLKTQDFIDETSEYSTAEKMVKALKDGYIDGTHCSLPTIANVLGIETEEAAKLLKNVKALDANGKEKSVKAKRTAKSIYEYFSSYTKEQVDSVLEELTDEEKELITLRYGEDLENPVPSKMTSKEANAFYCTLFRKIKKKLAVSELLKTQDFINESSEYSTDERIVKALREGYIDGAHSSLPTIASILGIEKEEAAKLLRNVETLDAKGRIQDPGNISRADSPILKKKLVNEKNLKA